MHSTFLSTSLWCALFAGQGAGEAKEKLFEATPLTQPKEFTPGIEGPACDKAGNIFAVNFAKQGTIGRVTPDGKGELWVSLPGKSIGNGIVFDRAGASCTSPITPTTTSSRSIRRRATSPSSPTPTR